MNSIVVTRAAVLVGFVSLVSAAGCQNTYYKAWEKLGYAKRDILVSRVENARDDQQAAKEMAVFLKRLARED